MTQSAYGRKRHGAPMAHALKFVNIRQLFRQYRAAHMSAWPVFNVLRQILVFDFGDASNLTNLYHVFDSNLRSLFKGRRNLIYCIEI